jgi:hypothetical protein
MSMGVSISTGVVLNVAFGGGHDLCMDRGCHEKMFNGTFKQIVGEGFGKTRHIR